MADRERVTFDVSALGSADICGCRTGARNRTWILPLSLSGWGPAAPEEHMPAGGPRTGL
jgi:hypothetical protein